MRTAMVLGLLWAATASAATPDSVARGAAPAPTSGARPGLAPRVRTVTFGIRHRVFPDFAQLSEVRMRETFQVGDSPYTARVIEFVPDFSMNLDTRKVASLSKEPRNPAFRVVVMEKGAPSDTTWAFLNMPPHFARKSMLGFQVLRIAFTNRAAITASDTTMLLKNRR